MTKSFFVIMFFITVLSVYGQQKKGKEIPVFKAVSNKDVVLSVFKDAENIDKLNDFWYKINNKKAKQLGYAMTSLDYCKEVVGYHNNTPVMIITDMKFNIIKVALLSNWESLKYVNKLANYGFFDIWSKKTLKQAQSVTLDGFTGATKTAKAVGLNVQFLLTNGLANLPKKK